MLQHALRPRITREGDARYARKGGVGASDHAGGISLPHRRARARSRTTPLRRPTCGLPP